VITARFDTEVQVKRAPIYLKSNTSSENNIDAAYSFQSKESISHNIVDFQSDSVTEYHISFATVPFEKLHTLKCREIMLMCVYTKCMLQKSWWSATRAKAEKSITIADRPRLFQRRTLSESADRRMASAIN
jgi:hypothetical protein